MDGARGAGLPDRRLRQRGTGPARSTTERSVPDPAEWPVRYVDKAGKVKIAPQFEQAAPFSDGLAVVSMGGRAGYIDKDGKFAINPQFDSGAPFTTGSQPSGWARLGFH